MMKITKHQFKYISINVSKWSNVIIQFDDNLLILLDWILKNSLDLYIWFLEQFLVSDIEIGFYNSFRKIKNLNQKFISFDTSSEPI